MLTEQYRRHIWLSSIPQIRWTSGVTWFWNGQWQTFSVNASISIIGSAQQSYRYGTPYDPAEIILLWLWLQVWSWSNSIVFVFRREILNFDMMLCWFIVCLSVRPCPTDQLLCSLKISFMKTKNKEVASSTPPHAPPAPPFLYLIYFSFF